MDLLNVACLLCEPLLFYCILTQEDILRQNKMEKRLFFSLSCSLQTLSLDGNHLSSLPDELGGLAQLNSLGLSFNNFSYIPFVLESLSAVDKLAMAGNRVEGLDLCTLARMSHLKNIDLR